MAKHKARRRTRTNLQRFVIFANVAGCLASLGLAGGLTWTYQQVREIPRIELEDQLAATDEGAGPSGQAENFLVIGTDSAEGLAADDPVQIGRDHGVRTDTLMVVRIDPSTEQAAVLSIPRDLWVHIAGTRGSGRINAAIQGEGPARLLATINDALDIPIHHYVEIDFEGFRSVVDALGGVPVYFPDPVRDRKSGLSVPDPGCVTLDPVQALAYARSRAFEYQEDGRWHVDGTGDLGRISRQQDFIRRVLHRAFQRGARNPLVLRNLLDVGVHAITLDQDLTLDDLRELGTHFREFNPDDLLSYNLPVYDDVEDGAQVLKLDNRAAQRTLDVFRGQDPARVAPDNTVVLIQNGTSETGLGQEAADGLRGLGFVVPPDQTYEADSFDVQQTTVYYTRGNEARAALLASALGVDPVVESFPLIIGGDVSVLIGADWQGVAPELRAETPGLVPQSTGTTTTTRPGATTTTAAVGATTSTTRVIGEVPAQPTTGC